MMIVAVYFSTSYQFEAKKISHQKSIVSFGVVGVDLKKPEKNIRFSVGSSGPESAGNCCGSAVAYSSAKQAPNWEKSPRKSPSHLKGPLELVFYYWAACMELNFNRVIE